MTLVPGSLVHTQTGERFTEPITLSEEGEKDSKKTRMKCWRGRRSWRKGRRIRG
jgi:hypothetical protein